MSGDGVNERLGPTASEHVPDIRTSPTQLLTGLSAGLPTSRLVCADCGVELTEKQPVAVYVQQLAERTQWDVRRWYCSACGPSAIESPTLGVTELLAQAWLGTKTSPRTGTSKPCLTDVAVIDYSSPEEDDRL